MIGQNNCRALVVLLLVVLVSVVKPAVSLSCYQCDSADVENPFMCTEGGFIGNGLAPQPCPDIYNVAYCVKLVGRYEGGVGVKRFCSAFDLGNRCDYLKQPGDVMEYRTCVYSCNSDNCNRSSRVDLVVGLIGVTQFTIIWRWLSI